MKELAEKINEIKSEGALDYAVEDALKINNPIDNEVSSAIQEKLEELTEYSGVLLSSNYNYDGDVYYFLLRNDNRLELCVVYNETDYHKLRECLEEIDTKLPITISGNGFLMQGNKKIRFNTALNTQYIES